MGPVAKDFALSNWVVTIALILVIFPTACHLSVIQPASAESSPFFDLRNEPESRNEPSADTSPAESGTSSPVAPSKDTNKTTPSDNTEQKQESSTQESERTSDQPSPESDAKRREDQSEQRQNGPSSEPSRQSSEKSLEEASDQSQGPKSEAPPRWTYHRQPLIVNPDQLQFGRVEIPDTFLQNPEKKELSTDTTSSVLAAVYRPTSNWFSQLIFHPGLIVTLAVLGLVGLYRSIPRRRVKIIKTANHTANKYLNHNRTQPGGVFHAEDKKQSLNDKNGDDSSDRIQENGLQRFEILPSPEQLADLGIDPDYHELFRMREEGKEFEAIIQQTHFRSGEAGLVFDLVERRFRNRDVTE